MMERLTRYGINLLRWSEKYTKTDMVYFVRGSFWLLVNQAVIVLIGFGVSVAFGHFASQDMYGNYRYVLTLSGLFAALSLSGLSVAVAQSTAKGFDGALSQGFKLNARWSFGLVFLSLVGAGYYFFFQHNDFLALSCLLIAFFTPILNGASLYDSYLTGKKEFKLQAIYDIVDRFLPALLLVATLFLTTRAIILIAVYFGANAATDAFFYVRSLRLAKNKVTDPGLLNYSGHLSIMNIITTLADKIDSLTVFALLGPAQLAVYTFATAMPEQIKSIVNILTPLSTPGFVARSMSEIGQTIWYRTLLLFVGLLAALALYIALAPILFRYLFPLYTDAIVYSQWYTLSIIFAAISTPLGAVLQAQKKTHALYIANNTSSVLLIILVPLLGYFYGIFGIIASIFAYRAFASGLFVWQFLRAKAG